MPWHRLPSARRWWALGLSAAALWVSTAAAESPALVRWSSLRWQDKQAKADDERGKERTLGLDASLQEPARLLLQRARPYAGALAVIEVSTGKVLAAVEVRPEGQGSLLFEPLAPAASVFKLVTTIALYERTNLTPSSKVCTKGGIRSVNWEHLSPATGPGSICSAFGTALGVSRNAAYAQLATQKLLRDDLLEVAERLGFNGALSADVVGHVGTLEVPYNDLDFARTATGFQNSRLSVLGAAQIALSIASGGVKKPLHFALDEADAPAPPPAERLFSARSARRLTRAMEITVQSGTAREAFLDERGRNYLGAIQVAGKTGTLRAPESPHTASWFVGFAPSQKPEIVVSAVLLNPELWHRKGHQLARDMLRVHFARRGVRGVTSPLDAPAPTP